MNNSIQAIKDVLKVFEDHGFSVSIYEEDGKECGIEIEDWTSGGVDMVEMLDFRWDKNIFSIFDILDEVQDIVNCFDVDEEIDVHREDKKYRENFTHSDSVKDFTEWKEHLQELAQSVEQVVVKWQETLTKDDFNDIRVTMRSIVEE
jgi:hypothetical protein